MSKKLQNVNAVNKILVGEHKFQTNKTHGFLESKKDTKKRLVGETWEETDPKSGITYLYEQKAYTRTYKIVSNADGKTETIDARMTPAEFADKVEREFEEYQKQFMQTVAKMETHND